MKKIDKVRELAQKNPYFTIYEVLRLIENKDYAYLILNQLEKRGEIFRLARGFYSKYDDPSLIVYYFKPAYIGLHDAMSYLNLWEQETITIVITVKNVRRGMRKTLGNNILVRRIKPKYFFGFDLLKVDDIYLPVSDVEKTLIDLIYFKEWKDEYLKYFRNRVNPKTLKEYLGKYPRRIKEKTLKILQF